MHPQRVCQESQSSGVSKNRKNITIILIPYKPILRQGLCPPVIMDAPVSFIPSPNLLYWNDISRFAFRQTWLVEFWFVRLRLSATSGDGKEGKQQHLTLSLEGFLVCRLISQLYPPIPLPRTGSQPVSLKRTRSASNIVPFAFLLQKKQRLWWDRVCLDPNFPFLNGPKDREL